MTGGLVVSGSRRGGSGDRRFGGLRVKEGWVW